MKSKIISFLGCIILSQIAVSEVNIHQFPRICPRSDQFKVRINNQDAAVYYTTAGSFVSFEVDEDVSVQVTNVEQINSIEVKPKRLGIQPVFEGKTATFTIPANEKILVEINNPIANKTEQLFIYSNKMVAEKPDPNDPDVHYFKASQVYETGEILLTDNQTVYIEGGAVVRGNIHAVGAKNITIAGLGVLDGAYYKGYEGRPKTVLTEDCSDVTIKDITMINPQAWTLMLYYTGNVVIDNLKQITTGHGSDGIDIVSSQNIHIKNSILSNGDDCIVVKAFQGEQYTKPVHNQWEGVEDVLVTGCAVQSNLGGQAFEIGHELLQDPITNIRFEDCDVLGVHGQGGVFGIHNSDGANVSDVFYENIRVDHFYNKLVDMRVIKSRWSRDPDRGYINNVVLKDIEVAVSIYNPGYSISLIGGYDKNHKVKNVTFDNFRLNGEKVTNADQLDLFIKQAEGVRFK